MTPEQVKKERGDFEHYYVHQRLRGFRGRSLNMQYDVYVLQDAQNEWEAWLSRAEMAHKEKAVDAEIPQNQAAE